MQAIACVSVISPTIWDTSPGEALPALPWKGTAGWGALGVELAHGMGSAGTGEHVMPCRESGLAAGP